MHIQQAMKLKSGSLGKRHRIQDNKSKSAQQMRKRFLSDVRMTMEKSKTCNLQNFKYFLIVQIVVLYS